MYLISNSRLMVHYTYITDWLNSTALFSYFTSPSNLGVYYSWLRSSFFVVIIQWNMRIYLYTQSNHIHILNCRKSVLKTTDLNHLNFAPVASHFISSLYYCDLPYINFTVRTTCACTRGCTNAPLNVVYVRIGFIYFTLCTALYTLIFFIKCFNRCRILRLLLRYLFVDLFL